MLHKVLLGILAALADLLAVVSEPGAGLLDQVEIRCNVEDIALPGNPFSEHNIEFSFLEGGSNLVLHDFDSRPVSDDFTLGLDGLDPADIEADGGIELQGPAAGRGLGISEHDADLLTELIDEDDDAVRLRDDRRKLPQGLGHQPRLQADLDIPHLPVNLGLGNQGRDGVNDDDIHCPGPDHGLCNLKGLLAVVRLGNVKIVNIDTDMLRIYGIQSMLGVDEARNAAPLLYFGYRMQCNGGLS